MTSGIRDVPLFRSLPESDLLRLEQTTEQCSLAKGEVLFEEGDEPDRAYVIETGELEILKESAGRRVRIAVSGPGDVVGEMGLLTAEPRSATARAISTVTMFTIQKASLDAVLADSAPANRALFDVFISRWREQESRVRQSERMAQIGVLTAGLAHEMNNPAAAVSSSADRLREVLAERSRLAADVADAPQPTPSGDASLLSALERAEREESLEDTMAALGVEEPWRKASILVDAGFSADDLEGSRIGPTTVDMAVLDAEASALLAELSEGARRLSELVAALKSYSFLDQAPVQDVDITKGIDDTLLILRSKLAGITVERAYDEQTPAIIAYGNQLNQVWTNLLDNAADAINRAGVEDGHIAIRVYPKEECVVVEVENNGPAIPPDVIDRIFEAFFTTKPPGEGTGLGLDTAYSIVVNTHRGSLDVASVDDSTVFTVVLPTTQDAATL